MRGLGVKTENERGGAGRSPAFLGRLPGPPFSDLTAWGSQTPISIK
jgi:hypothetical protein